MLFLVPQVSDSDFDGQLQTQVADFGLAKLTNDTHTHVSTRVMGTFGWVNSTFTHHRTIL